MKLNRGMLLSVTGECADNQASLLWRRQRTELCYLTAAPLCPRGLSCSAGAVLRQGRGNVKCAGLAAH